MSVCTGGSGMFFTWENSINCTVICNTHDWWTPLHSNMFPLCTESSCKASPQCEFLHVFVNYFHGQMTLKCAGVGFSTSVNSIMFQQTKLINKQLSTFEAAGGFFPSVKSHMCYQWFFYQETIWWFFRQIFRP